MEDDIEYLKELGFAGSAEESLKYGTDLSCWPYHDYVASDYMWHFQIKGIGTSVRIKVGSVRSHLINDMSLFCKQWISSTARCIDTIDSIRKLFK